MTSGGATLNAIHSRVWRPSTLSLYPSGMPRSHVKLICSCKLMCVFALLAAFRLSAQAALNSSVPTEPKSLVLALAAGNGAPAPDAKPWHLKISFTTYNWNGRIESQGVMEEFWLAPSRYKRIFETTIFNQVEYSTLDGIRRTGSRDEAPLELERIFDEFLRPVPFDAESIQAAQVEMKNANYIKAKLLCVSATRGGTSSEQAVNATFCRGELAYPASHDSGKWRTRSDSKRNCEIPEPILSEGYRRGFDPAWKQQSKPHDREDRVAWIAGFCG